MVRIAIGLILLLLVPSVAHAEKRVALVIGNSAYRHAGELANPKNDATDIAAALKKLGFQVLEGFDLDKANLDRKIRDFASALQGANVGLFFYSGHGLQVAGQNYIVPVDAELTTAAALDFEMVRLDLVHRTMEREAPTNILFLDACRNNPLARNLARALGTRSMEIGRGLAPVESGSGTLISFSTQPGNVASDGSGHNSPFTGPLVKHITNSNDDLSAILIAVRNDVMNATQRQQVPWENSALTKRIYFKVSAQAPVLVNPPQPLLSNASVEWTRVDKSSIAELETFVRRNASSPEADYARARLGELKRQQAEAVQQTAAAKKRADDEVRAKAERERLAMLQPQEDEKRRAEAEAAKKTSCSGRTAGSWDVSTAVTFPATLVMPQYGGWKWELKPDGPVGGEAIWKDGSQRKRYRCQGNVYTIEDFFGITLRLSPDGRRLDGACSDLYSSAGGGCRVNAVRSSD
jgi:uncharacterized caspase-like protein